MTFQIWNTKPQSPKISLQLSRLVNDCRNLPFWIEDRNKHKEISAKKGRKCCFTHLIGAPQKNGKEYPIFPYELLVVNTISKNQNIWIKKARGLGITEIILRYLAWACLSTSTLDNKHIFIVSGTREDFANHLKERLEKLFERKYPLLQLESKYTELWLNKTWIKVFPTRAVKDLRGYTDVAYLFIDEADFFDDSLHSELEDAINSYEEKSKGKIIMVSTPNKPGGLFEKIELDTSSKYRKLFLDYRYGMGTIYDTDFIEREKTKPFFDREYNLKYLGKIGNVFSLTDIETAMKLGQQHEYLSINPYALHVGSVDFGFSTSFTTVYVAEVDEENQIVRIVVGEEYDKQTPEFIANRLFQLHTEIPNLWWFVDGANRGAVNQCKAKYGEALDWVKADDISPETNFIIPVSFGKEHKSMLEWTYNLIAKQKIAIPPRFDKLILSLKTAYAEDFSLNKDRTVHNDHLDSLRLLCRGIKWGL